jgi:4,5-epoxidase
MMYEWWHSGGMAGAVFVDFTNKWHLSVESDKLPKGSPDLAQMQELFREYTGEPEAVLSNPSWIGALTINQRMPNKFMVDRTILAGDAAHVHSGAGGQGMNTSIQDALNLGWKLALVPSGRASSSLLQSYESERLPNARRVLRYTQRYHRIQLPRSALARWMAAAFFKAIQTIRPLGFAVAKKVGMLAVNYCSGPLSRHESSQGTDATPAGRHVPDLACRLDGTATRLFRVLRGPRANVLLFAGVDPTQNTFRALGAIAGPLRELSSDVRVLYVLASEIDARYVEMTGASLLTDGSESLPIGLGMRRPEIL